MVESRMALSSALLCFFAFCCISSCDASTDNLRFLVIGDWGGLPDFPYRTVIEKAVAREMGKVADKLDAHFTLALGDNFYFSGVKDVDDPRFQETYLQVFTSTSLHRPWYLVAGNHDHNGNVSAQIAFSSRCKQWNFPDFYYPLEMQIPGTSARIDILMLDTVMLCGNSGHDMLGAQPLGPEDPKLAEDQWTWVETMLQKSTAEYLIVAGHYPVLSVAEHGPTGCLVDQLMPLLYKYNVTAYFSGHDHNLQHLQYTSKNHKVDYFVSGSANFVDTSLKHKGSVPQDSLKFHWADDLSLGGFAHVEASPKNMTFTFLQSSGKQLYQHILYPRKL